jgi:hypothetical protein
MESKGERLCVGLALTPLCSVSDVVVVEQEALFGGQIIWAQAKK